ncbi:dihydrolipoyl dehydrogenase [Sodalis sp. CWE]|uniref:dihydrolipoyl dehydrogenase n=1 Tax=Sodalis sp. CWE TaxID=2803816 RepID=UPI001C7DD5FE|nr:dihydrolipoyl dehydrogenase [Sodalis sp. CWE]MBX4180696.1 dihydrolipoyl dehydrogenase [Sodalis sp. CWE]
MNTEIKAKVLVLGGGPGGYSSAFRCADLGLETVLVERYSTLGGVCLNVGCIPSKALLQFSRIIKETDSLRNRGIFSGNLKINIEKIRLSKEKIVNQLVIGLKNMAAARKVKIINGTGRFINSHTLQVKEAKSDSVTSVVFEHAIIAAGSRPAQLSCIPYEKENIRIWNSTDALSLMSIPKKLLVIGGGVIGLEIGTIYHTLGSKIDIVEVSDQLLPLADQDIIKVFTKYINSYFKIMLETKVINVEFKKDGVYVDFQGKDAPLETQCYETILVAAGRIPNGKLLNASQAGVEVDNQGFIRVDNQMRTNIPHIYAVGDINGYPMLAHKSSYEGHIAAEVIAGKNHYFDAQVIPSISYTEPEVAWVGLTEKEAKNKGINYKAVTFPWSASGRAIASGCQNGITKLIFEKENRRILGGAVVGTNGGELLGEIGLAIEMGCNAQDIALTIHAHPTLYESIGLAAEIYEGTITELIK